MIEYPLHYDICCNGLSYEPVANSIYYIALDYTARLKNVPVNLNEGTAPQNNQHLVSRVKQVPRRLQGNPLWFLYRDILYEETFSNHRD